MVFAERYTTEELVERIEPELRKRFDIPNWLMYTLIAVSAVILLSVTGVIISRALSKGKCVQIVSSVDKPQETVIPNAIPEEEYENIVELTFVGDTYRWYTIEDDDGYNEPNHWKGFDDFAYRYWTDDGARWLSKEDGHELLYYPHKTRTFVYKRSGFVGNGPLFSLSGQAVGLVKHDKSEKEGRCGWFYGLGAAEELYHE